VDWADVEVAVAVLDRSEDDRVQNHDGGHREEGDQTTAELPRHGGSPTAQVEQPFEQAVVTALLWRSSSTNICGHEDHSFRVLDLPIRSL
jgi:hypothetical protein